MNQANLAVDMTDEFDIVIHTLQEKKDKLWKMTQSNMNTDMVNIMDDIRLEQIQELNEAMGMWLVWKDEKNESTKRD
jgi:hypothetical protein